MPYVSCTRCSLRSYSAAAYSGTDECPGCGVPLLSASGIRRWTSLEAVRTQAKRLAGRTAPQQHDR